MNTLSSPKIVRMIAALTDHRDVNLLEASLLKTVADLYTRLGHDFSRRRG